MLFQHINRHADKHRKRVYLVLVLVIGLSFVVFVTPRGTGSGGRSGKSTVAEVFGKKISQDKFVLAMNGANLGSVLDTGRLISSGSGSNNPLHRAAIQRLRELHEAKRLGLDAVSDEELIDYLKNCPGLQPEEGKFDPKVLENVRTYAERQMRVNGAEFDQIVRDNIAIKRLEDRVRSGIVVSPTEVLDQFNRENEELVLSYAEVSIDASKDGDPDDAELEAYFAAHQSELSLPDQKIVRVATFPHKGLEGEKLNAVRAKAVGMIVALREDGPEGESLDALSQRFDALAKEKEATVAESSAFGPDAKAIPGLAETKGLAPKAHATTPDKPVASLLDTGDAFCVTMLAKTVPGGKAEKLEQVRAEVVEAVLAEKATALFAEKCAPHAAEVQGLPTVWDYRNKVQDRAEGLPAEEKEKAMDEAQTLVSTYLSPVFKPEERTAWAVEFAGSSYIDKVQISDEQKKEYYEQNSAKYDKEELRTSQITFSVFRQADEKTKESIKKNAEEVLARLKKGEPFADVAKISADAASRRKGGDTGFAAKGTRDKAIETALETMKIGDLSDVLQTASGFAIVKLTDKRQGTPFEEAKAEITKILVDAECKIQAEDAAARFADAATAAFEKLSKAADEGADDATFLELGQKAFADAAKDLEVEIEKVDVPFDRNGGMAAPMDQRELVAKVFELAPALPLSAPVEAGGRSYVALLTGTVPGRLYSPDKEGEDIARKLSPVVRKEIATARAKAKADELRAAFVAALEKDGALPKTVADTEVKTTEPFTRAKPASMPELQAVLDEIDTAHAAPGTVLDPVKGRTSFMVVQVVSRTRPAADTLDEEQKEQLASQIRNIKASLAIVSFRRDLAARSEAVLFGEPVED